MPATDSSCRPSLGPRITPQMAYNAAGVHRLLWIMWKTQADGRIFCACTGRHCGCSRLLGRSQRTHACTAAPQGDRRGSKNAGTARTCGHRVRQSDSKNPTRRPGDRPRPRKTTSRPPLATLNRPPQGSPDTHCVQSLAGPRAFLVHRSAEPSSSWSWLWSWSWQWSWQWSWSWSPRQPPKTAHPPSRLPKSPLYLATPASRSP